MLTLKMMTTTRNRQFSCSLLRLQVWLMPLLLCIGLLQETLSTRISLTARTTWTSTLTSSTITITRIWTKTLTLIFMTAETKKCRVFPPHGAKRVRFQEVQKRPRSTSLPLRTGSLIALSEHQQRQLRVTNFSAIPLTTKNPTHLQQLSTLHILVMIRSLQLMVLTLKVGLLSVTKTF